MGKTQHGKLCKMPEINAVFLKEPEVYSIHHYVIMMNLHANTAVVMNKCCQDLSYKELLCNKKKNTLA